MNNFKLLAIRPLKGCNKRIIKILKPNQLYKFYNNYQYEYENNDENGDVSSIIYTPCSTDNLFYLKTKYKVLPINISAIVGKNGSGKSSLVELIYVSIYQISVKLGLLPEKSDKGEPIRLEKNIKVELYYLRNKEFIRLQILGNNISMNRTVTGNFSQSEKFELTTKDLYSMFYTLVINYSHYSLNENHIGKWVKHIFHKNDGYQSPIVINPFRDEGEIDINNEEYLTRSRLISNLLRPATGNSHLILAPRQEAQQIRFRLSNNKSKFDKDDKAIEALLKNKSETVLNLTFQILARRKQRLIFNNNAKLKVVAFNYILKKLYTISKRYKPYSNPKFVFIKEKKENRKRTLILDTQKLYNFLYEIKKDSSHITFKLRQAINFVENYEFYYRKIGKWQSIKRFSRELNNKKSKLKPLIQVIPPSFFTCDIKFKNGSLFNHLSSGEKQKIFASSTLIYHLTNLSSVGRRRFVKFKSINIVFDEIELYYHPDLQRTFIHDILTDLENIEIRDVDAINFLFITHSPFILSDIPNSNTIVLDGDARPVKEGLKIETFGANIFDLLKNNFFLEKGPMGEFAKSKINDLIIWLENPKRDSTKNDYYRGVIQLIGEPILQTKLAEMYDRVTKEKSEIQIIQNRIRDLEDLLKEKTNAHAISR